MPPCSKSSVKVCILSSFATAESFLPRLALLALSMVQMSCSEESSSSRTPSSKIGNRVKVRYLKKFHCFHKFFESNLPRKSQALGCFWRTATWNIWFSDSLALLVLSTQPETESTCRFGHHVFTQYSSSFIIFLHSPYLIVLLHITLNPSLMKRVGSNGTTESCLTRDLAFEFFLMSLVIRSFLAFPPTSCTHRNTRLRNA